jgi:hypothetical protein
MNVPDNEPEIGALSKKVEREQNWRKRYGFKDDRRNGDCLI